MTLPSPTDYPKTLRDLRRSGWRSRTVKAELRKNLTAALRITQPDNGERPLFPGMVGYDATVIPEIVNAVLAGHDMLFLGEKGQGKSRLMRQLVRFLDPFLPYLDIADEMGGCPVHEDPERPITKIGREFLTKHGEDSPIAWWPREARYAERLAPGTKFADVIGVVMGAQSGPTLGCEFACEMGA